MAADDYLLGGAVRLRQADQAFRAAVDAPLLASFLPAGPGARALDVGCGAGAALLCLAARLADAHLTGLDLQPDALARLAENAGHNGWTDRIAAVLGDVADAPLAGEDFDAVFTNPPFLPESAADPPRDAARRLSMVESVAWGDWAAFCLKRLRTGGWFACVHRADRLPDLLKPLTPALGEIAIAPIRPRPGGDAHRVLIRGRKGAKGPARLMPGLTLHADGDAYSETANRILRAPVFFDSALI